MMELSQRGKISINIRISEASYNLLKGCGMRQSYIFEEGLKHLLGRGQTNKRIEDEENNLKQTNLKLLKVNEILQNQIYKLNERIADLERK